MCYFAYAQDAISGECSLIDQVMLFGQDERFLGAVVCLNPMNMAAADIISQVRLTLRLYLPLTYLDCFRVLAYRQHAHVSCITISLRCSAHLGLP